jgi:hypothetical protein
MGTNLTRPRRTHKTWFTGRLRKCDLRLEREGELSSALSAHLRTSLAALANCPGFGEYYNQRDSA